MKILFIHNYFHIKSGSGTIMFIEANILREKGHEVFFFTTDKEPFYEKDYKYSNYFPKYLDYRSLSKWELLKNAYKPFYNIEAERKICEFLEEIKPDVVHNHTSSFHLTPSVLRACYDSNIPVVLTIHGAGYMCPAQTLMINGTKYCDKELCIRGDFIHCMLNRCSDKGFKNDFITTLVFSFYKLMRFYNNISAFIIPSRALLDISYRSGIERNKLHLINNCLDNSYFQIQPEYGNKGYFLYIGRLDREKGVHYLLEAMSMLSREIKLHIVGIGDQEEELKSQAENLNLYNIEFLGFKKGKDLEKEYRNCIGSILPCNWFENFPTTVLESFVYGKPVIASNIGGIPEIIDNHKNGLLIEPGNVEELSKAIEYLYKNPQKVIEFGIQGRKKAERDLNPESHYEKLIEVYGKVSQGAIYENSRCK